MVGDCNPRRCTIIAFIKLAIYYVANSNVRHIHRGFLDILSGKRVTRGVHVADVDVRGMAGLVVIEAAFRNRTGKNVAFVHLLHKSTSFNDNCIRCRVYTQNERM